MDARVAQVPGATWGMAALLCVVFASVAAAPDVAGAMAFRPARPWDLAGLTVVTYGLVHATSNHLVTNVVFLLLFGPLVERRRGATLLVGVAVAGIVAGAVGHALVGAAPTVPLVGASGGVAAVLGATAVCCGTERLPVVRLRVRTAVGAWLALQVVTAPSQLVAGATVSVGAHLAGLLAGMVVAGVTSSGEQAAERAGQTGARVDEPVQTVAQVDLTTERLRVAGERHGEQNHT